MTTTTRLTRMLTGAALAACLAVIGYVAVDAQGQDARQLERDQLLRTRACDRCDLSGVDLSRQDVSGVSLAEANLTGASFYSANLANANLGGANLTKANLTMANLANTNLGLANLAGANLNGSTGASLAGATTTETTTCPDGNAGPCR